MQSMRGGPTALNFCKPPLNSAPPSRPSVETLAHDANNGVRLDDAIRLMEAFHSSDASATRFLASRNPADFDTTRVDTQAMGRSFQALQAPKCR